VGRILHAQQGDGNFVSVAAAVIKVSGRTNEGNDDEGKQMVRFLHTTNRINKRKQTFVLSSSGAQQNGGVKGGFVGVCLHYL
jgi:hypothetical protein